MMTRNPWSNPIASGYRAQYLENIKVNNVYTITATTVFSIDTGNASFNDGLETGVKLPPGVWDLQAIIQGAPSAGTTTTLMRVFCGTGLGISTAGEDSARNETTWGAMGTGYAAAQAGVFQSPLYRVRVLPGTTQTWYAKALVTFAVSSFVANGGIMAWRVGNI